VRHFGTVFSILIDVNRYANKIRHRLPDDRAIKVAGRSFTDNICRKVPEERYARRPQT